MSFTWMKEFGELEEKSKPQNKKRKRKMNQKDSSLFAKSPEKIRMIFNQNL